jgi:hypothetical protein
LKLFLESFTKFLFWKLHGWCKIVQPTILSKEFCKNVQNQLQIAKLLIFWGGFFFRKMIFPAFQEWKENWKPNNLLFFFKFWTNFKQTASKSDYSLRNYSGVFLCRFLLGHPVYLSIASFMLTQPFHFRMKFLTFLR